MAKQVDTQWEGTIGNTIGYKWRNEFLYRAKGNTGKQGEATKAHSARMGKASALSARIRKALSPMLTQPGNRPMMYRLNFALLEWLRTGMHETFDQADNIPFLNGFSFHYTKEKKTFDVSMGVSRTPGGLLLHIPAFDSPNPIYPLPFNGQVNLHIMAVSCSLNPGDTQTYETTEQILYDGTPLPAQQLFLPFETSSGSLTVVALSINKNLSGLVGAMWG